MRHKINKLIRKGKFDIIRTSNFNIATTYYHLKDTAEYIERTKDGLLVYNNKKLTLYIEV